MGRGRVLGLFVFGAVATLVAVVGAAGGGVSGAAVVRAAAAVDPVIAAVGDIACDPGDASYNGGAGTAFECRQRYTSDLVVGAGLDGVLVLGDLQYEDGTLAKFNQSYEASWGRVKGITYPAVGNHEYQTAGAAGYFGYFGARAGDPTKGYYSFDLGGWHLIALNSECAQVGGCGPGSPQLTWLIQDLQANSSKACTLAFWHVPRFGSGVRGSNATYQPFWQALYDHRADVVLVGHDHVYERFAPQTPTGAADPGRGIRQFIVGTGGRNLHAFATVAANSELRRNDTFGILELTLRAASYDWEFVPEAGKTFTDTGSASCITPPTAAFTGSPRSGTAPLAVSFSDESTGAPTSWAWDFDGNGTVDSTQQNPSFTYQNPGTYTVKLTAANAHGNDDESKTAYVVVASGSSPPPPQPQPPVPTLPAPPPRPNPRPAAYSLAPSADGYTGAGRARLLFAGGPRGRSRSYLTFALGRVRGRVERASLRLYVSDGSTSRLTVQRCSAAWTERQLGKGTKPRLLGRTLAHARPGRRGRWLELRIPPALVSGNGKLCLALLAPGKDAAAFGSRESRTPPRLVVRTT